GFMLKSQASIQLSSLSLHDALPILPRIEAVMDELDRRVPKGMGPGGVWDLDRAQLVEVLEGGAAYAVEQGHGTARDLDRCEDRRSEEHTSELQSRENLVCRLLLEKK